MSNDNLTRIGPGVPIPRGQKPKRWFGIKPEFVIAAAVIIAMCLMIAAVFVYNGAFDRKSDRTFMIAGRMQVSGSNSNLAFGNSVGECRGKAGFGDLQEGAQVVVTDAGGKTVAIGRLGTGESLTTGGGNGSVARLVACTFPIEVRDVPEGEEFYRVGVTHRGTTEYTREQLRRPIQLTLG